MTEWMLCEREYRGDLESLYIQQNTRSDETYASSEVIFCANHYDHLAPFVRCLGSSFPLALESYDDYTHRITRTFGTPYRA